AALLTPATANTLTRLESTAVTSARWVKVLNGLPPMFAGSGDRMAIRQADIAQNIWNLGETGKRAGALLRHPWSRLRFDDVTLCASGGWLQLRRVVPERVRAREPCDAHRPSPGRPGVDP